MSGLVTNGTIDQSSLGFEQNQTPSHLDWSGESQETSTVAQCCCWGGGARVPRRLGFLVAACQPLVFARAPGATSWYHEAGSGFRGERKFPTGGRFSFKAFLWQELSVR